MSPPRGDAPPPLCDSEASPLCLWHTHTRVMDTHRHTCVIHTHIHAHACYTHTQTHVCYTHTHTHTRACCTHAHTHARVTHRHAYYTHTQTRVIHTHTRALYTHTRMFNTHTHTPPPSIVTFKSGTCVSSARTSALPVTIFCSTRALLRRLWTLMKYTLRLVFSAL